MKTQKLLAVILCILLLLPVFCSSVSAASAITTAPVVDQDHVQKRIEALKKYFITDGHKYFTTNQQPYSGDQDDVNHVNGVEYIVQQQWFKNNFGTLVNIAQQFTSHYSVAHKFDLGYSCCGFVSFAFWYIFSTSNTDRVVSQKYKYGKWTAEFMKNNCLPGDALRIAYKEGGAGHSMIFLSADDEGVTVLDCHMDGANGVQMQKFSYKKTNQTYGKWSNMNVTITRANNYDTQGQTQEPIKIEGNCAENYKMIQEGTLNCRLGPGTNYPLVRDGYGVGTGEQLIIVRKEQAGDGKTWGYGRGFNHALQTYLEGWFCLDGFTEHQFSYIPVAPVLHYEITAQDSAHITWNPVPNATSYAIYVNGQKAQESTDTSYDVSSNGESTVTVKVEAINSDFYYADIYPCTNVSEDTVLDFSSSDIEDCTGDLDSDGIKTIDDVIYLFWSIFDSVNYPVSVNTDYDRNGVNTIDDVIYLFWSIFDPVNYPL